MIYDILANRTDVCYRQTCTKKNEKRKTKNEKRKTKNENNEIRLPMHHSKAAELHSKIGDKGTHTDVV